MSSTVLESAVRLPSPEGTDQSAALRRRILVVDDDPSVLGLLSHVLERLDVDIDTCSDPEAALRRFDEFSYDVVISDDRMPKMSGRDMLAKVRGRRPETPTILITGFGSPQKLDDAFANAGVFSFVNKPWDNRALVDTVQDALRARRALA